MSASLLTNVWRVNVLTAVAIVRVNTTRLPSQIALGLFLTVLNRDALRKAVPLPMFQGDCSQEDLQAERVTELSNLFPWQPTSFTSERGAL